MTHRAVGHADARPADACVIRDEQLGVRHHMPDAHQFQRVTGIGWIQLDGCPDAQAMPVRANPAIVAAGFRERDRERGFGQTIHRIHGVALQSRVGERGHEFIAQGHGDRLGAVVYRAHCGEIGVLEAPLAQHFEEMPVAEVRGTGDGDALSRSQLQP